MIDTNCFLKRPSILTGICLMQIVSFIDVHAGTIAEDQMVYEPNTALHRWHGNSPKPKPDPALNGGTGWKGPWTQWFGIRENDARVYLKDYETADLSKGVPLGYEAQGEVSIEFKHASMGRELAQTAGGRGTTYIGYVTRHASGRNGNDDPIGVGMQLLQGGIQGQPVFSFFRKGGDEWGIDTKGDPAINNTGWKETSKVYYYLFKIVDDGNEATVFASRFTAADKIILEPTEWQVTGIKVPSFKFDTIYFKGNKPGFNNAQGRIWIDEVRLASSFSAMGFSQQNFEKVEAAKVAAAKAEEELQAKIKVRMQTAWEQGPVAMPEAANIANVVAYGAARDGATDDTTAINRALKEAKQVYFPPGTYLVSGTLQVGKGPSRHRLFGAGKEATTIRLKQDTFTDKKSPQAVIAFHKGYPTTKKTTGNAFGNYLTDMTIEVEAGNPGATAVAYITNNSGAIRNVAIRSVDQSREGFCGVHMQKGWCGPGIFKNVEITGFDTGIRYDYREYSMTLENLTLEEQKEVGILNKENTLAIRNLISENEVPVIQNGSSRAVTVLLDGDFRGGGGGAAIRNNSGFLYVRDTQAQGYSSLIEGGTGLKVEEYASTDENPKTLRLPVKDFKIEQLAKGEWVSVASHGANPEDKEDDSAAIQAAIDAAAQAGKKKLFFPYGGVPTHKGNHYRLMSKVRLHGSVQEVDFLFAALHVGEEGGFIVDEGKSPAVVFQRIGMVWGSRGTLIHHKANRDLVIRDFDHGHTVPYNNLGSTADVYMENVAPVAKGELGPFIKGQNVWGRSIDPEHSGVHFHNNGATVWILGFKTEKNGINVLTDSGGKTEILGGFIYPVKKAFKELTGDFPSFKAVDSVQSLVGLSSNANGGNNKVPVEEVTGGKSKELPASAFESAAFKNPSWFIPIYLSPGAESL
ncbi:MAG: glycoside hydrolase family 55 protein [Verrucomicrobiota bacterium]